jgi:hypothetical protein
MNQQWMEKSGMCTEKVSGFMRDLVAAAAGPRLEHDTRASWLQRAADNAGVSFRKAKAMFYGEVVNPNGKTAKKFREAAGRNEARNLASQFESLAHSLNVRDADFHSNEIVTLLSAARSLRGLDRSGTDEK